jgi:hypothetical protein
MSAPHLSRRGARRAPRKLLLGALALAPLLATAGFLAYAVERGLSPRHALTAAAAVGLVQVLPGALCWRAVRPRQGWLVEDLVMGFAIGCCLAIGAQVVAGLSRITWLSAAIPLAVGAVLILVPATRRRIVEARWTALPAWFGPVVALASVPVFPQLMSYFHRHELRWPPGAWQPHIDAYLHQALAAELLNRGPAAWPTVQGEDLGYHWFAHAWIAQTARVSGLGLDEVLLRFMPAVMPSIVVACAAVAALRLTGRPVVGALAGVLTMLGGTLNVFGRYAPGYPVEPLSPTLAMGAPTLLALVVVLAVRWRGESLRGAFVLVPLLAVAAAGTKGSTSPLVVAGLGVALVAMLVWDRSRAVQVALDLVVVTAALVFTVIVVFHGSSAGLTLGIDEAAQQTATGTWLGPLDTPALRWMAIVTSVLGVLARGAAGFALPFSARWRKEPLTWLLLGACLAGAGALAVFSHPGKSQWYFALTAIPLLSIASAIGISELARALGARRIITLGAVAVVGGVLLALLPTWVEGRLVTQGYDQAWTMVGIAAGVLVATALAGAAMGRGRSHPARGALAARAATAVGLCAVVSGLAVFTSSSFEPVKTVWQPVTTKTSWAVTQKQINAARYIRDHSAIDDVVMTNRHCTYPRSPFNGCDSRRWLVAAFSERQMLVEGWTATPKATELAPHGRDSITVDYWKPDILRLNDQFIAAPTEDAARRLWGLGVRWIYVEHTRPYAKTLEPYAVRRYRNSDAEAYQLLPPR